SAPAARAMAAVHAVEATTRGGASPREASAAWARTAPDGAAAARNSAIRHASAKPRAVAREGLPARACRRRSPSRRAGCDRPHPAPALSSWRLPAWYLAMTLVLIILIIIDATPLPPPGPEAVGRAGAPAGGQPRGPRPAPR